MARARATYRGPGVHVVIDVASRPLADAALVKAEGLATVLAVPVVDGDELIGALNVYSKDPARSFDEEDIEVAHVLAALAAATVLNTRAHALVVEQRELMRALFDELGDGVLVAQPGGTLSGMNRTARELTGLDDAMVSDIGGTTTDVAVLDGGRPRLDPEGATVGDLRRRLGRAYPALQGLLKRSALAVNEEFPIHDA